MASGEFLQFLRIFRDCSMRHQEVNRLLPPKTGPHSRQSALLLELRSNGRFRSPYPLSVASHFTAHFVVARVEVLAARYLLDHDGRRHGFARGVPLTFSKLVP